MYIGAEVYRGVTQADTISQLTHVVGGLCGAYFGARFSKLGPKLRKSDP